MDYRAIKIEITQTQSEAKGNKLPDSISTGENPNDEAKSSTDIVVKSIVGASLASHVSREALQIADYAIETKFRLTDDYIGQRNYNIAKSFISKGAILVAGAITGGPVGLAMAAVYTGISTGIEAAQAQIEQSITIANMNAQLDFTRVRAGYSLVAGSVGENK